MSRRCVSRVFLDANVLFSAAYRHDAGLRTLWKLSAVDLVTSHYALAEAAHNLSTERQQHDLNDLVASAEL